MEVKQKEIVVRPGIFCNTRNFFNYFLELSLIFPTPIFTSGRGGSFLYSQYIGAGGLQVQGQSGIIAHLRPVRATY